MRILCRTFFDCSPTGVTGHYRASQVPFTDGAGQLIEDQHAWTFARNQQRNWETLNQLISLRTQVFDVEFVPSPEGEWCFEFSVDHGEVYSTTGNPNDTSGLVNECAGVPMLTGLTESLTEQYTLIVEGPDQNIWFQPINKSLE